jgi:uncharacterized iron-regulated membrane protein
VAAGVFSVHKWAGLVTGAAFVVIALTGTVLTFLSELNLRGHRRIEPGAPLTHYAPAVADTIARHPGSTLLSIYVPAENAGRKTWQIFLRRSATDDARIVADLDPTTGRIVSERDFESTAFRFVLKLHYAFLAGTAGESVACIQLALPAVHGLALSARHRGRSLHVVGADDTLLLTVSAAASPLASTSSEEAIRAAFPILHL